MAKPCYRIALLFNANKVYDREVMAGVGEYIQTAKAYWDVFIEDDFVHRPLQSSITRLDGIIADFDNPILAKELSHYDIPIVAVGGSYHHPECYPTGIPYIATDNAALIKMAFEHLKAKGIRHFAFYGIPPLGFCHWSEERRYAFEQIMLQQQYTPHIYLGYQTKCENWQEAQQKLNEWVLSLPRHTGIIAVTDARARHLLQTCEHLNIAVPDELCIIGIDNEELIQFFSRVSLSSVVQGTKNMGYHAAKTLHNLLQEKPIKQSPLLLPPLRVEARTSTDYRSIQDPLVIQAMHYIRMYACSGIRTEQVLDFVKTSRSNLEKRFKQELDCTIHEALYAEKLDKAKNLLISSTLSINEVAEASGYFSLQYFYSVFKKEHQCTPIEYQQRHNKKTF